MRRSSIALLLAVCLTACGWVAGSRAQDAPRRDYTGGTGSSPGGFAGTWEDPETGDTVNSVIAPRQPQNQEEWPPIFVYPQVAPQWPPGPGGRPVPYGPGGQPGRPGERWPSPLQPPRR